MFFRLILLVFIAIYQVQCANILFYMNIASYSHRVAVYPLADALANIGHQITIISPFHPKQSDINPKITEIIPVKLAQTMEAFLSADFDINFRVQKVLPRNVYAFYPTAKKSCEDLLTSPELDAYLQKTTSLDLLILDTCMTECAMGIAHKYKAKHIFYGAVTVIGNEPDLYGFAPESSAIPELELFQPRVPMSFLQRVENVLMSLHFRYTHYNYVKDIDALIRKHSKDTDSMPFVDDLARNASLVLYNADIVTDFPRSLPPMVKNVGGLHCNKGKSPEQLPKDVKEFLRGETKGFVYISLGSLVVSSNLPEQIKQVFFQSIESFPELKFLWKWNGPFPEKIPKNLFLSQWFPQVDLLAHPQIKAFVTQSGRPSLLESLCNKVPMIAFPVLGDQDGNANRMNDMGGNIKLELGTVTKEELTNAIKTTVYDEKMRLRLAELKNIFDDRPMSPLDTAVWWTEYVLRMKDTNHLKPAGFHQSWWQRRLLDVWAFLFFLVLLALISIILIITFIINLVRSIFKSSKPNRNGADVNKKKK